MKGYWGMPEATEQTFGDGWLKSGDLARVDEEGFVYIVDRAKDMVIRGGENVYCVEVEGVLFEHPEVADAAVIGVPHQVLGEEVGAVIVRSAGSTLTADELRAHVAARLAGVQGPGARVLPRRAAAAQSRRQGAQARAPRRAGRLMATAAQPLLGKVALVTGGQPRARPGDGARVRARPGASVVIASRKLDACEALADEVGTRFGVDALAVAANVSSWDDCDALVGAAYERFGRVDVLVNNAGMSPLYPSVDRRERSAVRQGGRRELQGPVPAHLARSARAWPRGGGGSIINISSVEAERPEPSALPYAAAKAGLEALTLGLRPARSARPSA